MHNSIKASVFFRIAKAVLFSLLLLLLSACGKGVKITEIDKSYETESQLATVQIPQISGLASKDLENAVNDEFTTVTNELLNKFSEAAKKTGEKSRFEMQTTEYFNKNGLLSMVTDYEYFARKSHKSRFRIAKNIDTEGCIELSLSDLFEDDGYIDALNAMLFYAVAAEPEKYADLWAKPKIMQNQGFYIDGENLVLYYPPYELSYYERGFVEIPVPIEELLTYMRPEYREVFMD